MPHLEGVPHDLVLSDRIAHGQPVLTRVSSPLTPGLRSHRLWSVGVAGGATTTAIAVWGLGIGAFPL
jgi:hypothetical protein